MHGAIARPVRQFGPNEKWPSLGTANLLAYSSSSSSSNGNGMRPVTALILQHVAMAPNPKPDPFPHHIPFMLMICHPRPHRPQIEARLLDAKP